MVTVLAALWWFWLYYFWALAFPLDLALLSHPRARARMERGVIRRYLRSKLGPFGPSTTQAAMLFLFLSISISFMFVNSDISSFFLALYWTLLIAWQIIDVITGGDEPRRRLRKKAAELAKKFRLAPAPRPVIAPR
jgi:hypothetical protein